jgi:hypothetical protein
MVYYQVGVDNLAKIAEELENFRFGDIIRQIAYKEFQAAAPWDCDRQESLSATKMQENCKRLTRNTMRDRIYVRTYNQAIQ